MLPDLATGKSTVWVDNESFDRWRKGTGLVSILFFNHDVRDEPVLVNSWPGDVVAVANRRISVRHSEDAQIRVGMTLTVFNNPYVVREVKLAPIPDFSVAYLVPWTVWDKLGE